MPVSPASMVPPMTTIDTQSLGVPMDGDAEEVATSFEAVFASFLTKEMRKTLADGFFGSEGSDILGGLFDLHMGQAMTNGRGLGIKQMVLSQLESRSPQE